MIFFWALKLNIVSRLSDLTDKPGFETSYDIVVIGAGGAGLSAALFAAIGGARVLLVEHTGLVGGTTALSAGTTWIPGTHHAASVNPTDTVADAARYLTNAVGELSSAALRQVFLEHGFIAVRHLEENSDVKYRAYAKHPDYISNLEGSTLNGRALEPLPFDGRLLGNLLKLIRPPIPEFTVLGGMMVDRTDINHLLGMTSSLTSFKHSMRMLARHAMDRLSHQRGTRLVMGNALVGRLLYSLSQHSSVTLALNTSLQSINRDQETVNSLELQQNGQLKTIKIAGGVILASGGFNRHCELRNTMLPSSDPLWCPGAPGHTGQAQDAARKLGAHYGKASATHAFWAPVSLRKRVDGSTAVFPHFVMDRAKPGILTVNQLGERFVNESTSYHLFALAMQKKASPGSSTSNTPAYLIGDATALRKYGMGMVRPGTKNLNSFLVDGYLTQANSVSELATKLNINTQSLQDSISRMNAYAKTGIDLDFQRGVTAYQRNIGDPDWAGANPNLGPLTQAPYYAVRLYPGDIGASTGLETTPNAQVLDANQKVISGLYAVGNDMHSIMGGVYTAPGITIGPGLVFAYLAAKHAIQTTKRRAA